MTPAGRLPEPFGAAATARRGLVLSRLGAVGALLLASGCGDCGGGPSVPFAIDGSTATGPAADAAAPTPSPPIVLEGAAAPDPGKIVVGGRTIAAPEGHRFVQVLGGDADRDGVDDAFAWASAGVGTCAGRLLFVSGAEGDARDVHVDESPGTCTTTEILRRLGDETVLLTLHTAAPTRAPPRVADRLVVVRLPPRDAGAPEARLVVDVRPLPGDETLAVEVSAVDRDADGREDVVLRATLTGSTPGASRATADVVYLDRPAGYTLEPSEPEASFTRAAADLARRARVPADAAAAASAATASIRLATALCGELGAAVVTTTAGAVRCGEMRGIADAFAVHATAALTARDLPRAFAAFGALRALGERATTQTQALEKTLAREAPVATARVVARLPLEPDRSTSPSTPPFAWDAEGGLIVLRAAGPVRITREGTEEDAAAAPWPRAVRWSSGGDPVQLATVVRACGPASLRATIERRGTPAVLILPDLLPMVPRGLLAEPCTAGRVDVGVLSLGADRAVLAVGPTVVALVADGREVRAEEATVPGPTDPPAPPGGARSSDGTTAALLVGGDALVLGAKTRRWRAPEIASASACSPAPGGARLACVGARGVALLEREGE